MDKENEGRRVSVPSISGLPRRPLQPRASQPNIAVAKPILVRTASLPVVRSVLLWGPFREKENLDPSSVAGLVDRFEKLKADRSEAKEPESSFRFSEPGVLIPLDPNSELQKNDKLELIEEIDKTLVINNSQSLEENSSPKNQTVYYDTDREAALNESQSLVEETASASHAPVERSYGVAPRGVQEVVQFVVREDDALRARVQTPFGPAVSKSLEDSTLEIENDELKTEEKALQKKHNQHWIKFYHPYLEESVRYQVGLETGWPETGPEITSMRGLRMMLIDWLAMVQSFLRQRDVVLQMSVRLLDRVLAAVKISTRDLQLVAITTFWIAAKIELQHEITASKLLALCKDSYSKRQLCRAEAVILRALDFRVPHDTPLSLVAYQASVLGLDRNETNEVRHVAGFLLDVSLLSWELSWSTPSRLACAATCCALTLLSHNLAPHNNGDILWDVLATTNPAFHCRSSLTEVIAGQLRLLTTVQDPASKFKGLRDKYRSSRHLRIASHPVMSEENIYRARTVLLPGSLSMNSSK